MSYVETSAKTGSGVIPAFETLIRMVREMEGKSKKLKSSFKCFFFSCGPWQFSYDSGDDAWVVSILVFET